MKLNKKVILILMIIGLFSIVSVSAADNANITTDLISDEGDVPVSVGEKTFSDLQTEINKDGESLNLSSDYIYNDGFTKTGIVINKTLTINGNGHTLDGDNTGRILNIVGGEVVLSNITFQNGYSNESMGAIRCLGGKLTIKDCTFNHNYGDGVNGKYNEKHEAIGVVGGAVYIYSNDCTIVNNEFRNNYVHGSGGALAVDGNNHVIENNTFIYNRAYSYMNGGALHVGQGANTTIRGNTFEDNFAGMGGGALELQNSSGDVIENNIFRNNTAEYGGAVSIYHTGYFTLKNNTFYGNHVEPKNPHNNATDLSVGAAIRVYLIDSSKTSYITENTVSGSLANTSGGAFYILGDNIEISKNTFIKNTATVQGGGTILALGNKITITNNNISDSTAGTTGGAIYIEGDEAKITSNNFTNTKAQSGGAIYIKGDSAVVSDNTFKDSSADVHSGAVYIKGINEKVTNNNFINDTAGNNGGALRIDQTRNTEISGNVFTNDNAPDGSDIKLTGNSTQIIHNTFNNYNTKSVAVSGSNNVIKENKGIVDATAITANARTYLVTKAKSFNVILKDAKGNVLASKSVSLTVNGKTYKATTNAKGIATFKLAITKIGTFKATVKFAKETYYAASSKTVNVKVIKEKSKISAPSAKLKRSKAKKITVTLKSNSGAALAKKTVILKVAGKNFKAKTNAKGKAAIKVKVNKKGKFTYKVTFKGDSKYYGITKKGKITVR